MHSFKEQHMKKYNTIIITISSVLFFIACTNNRELNKFPKGYTPEEVGLILSERFVPSDHFLHRNQWIHYPEVCAFLGSLRFADATQNDTLLEQLQDRFEVFFTTEKDKLPPKDHVDMNMFGCLPLEFYKITGDKRYFDLGIPYADSQWEVPQEASDEEKTWAVEGFSWQTRLWIDDMYMITAIQSQAYNVTGDLDYIVRTACEMTLYLDELQMPNGLFYHAPDV